VPTPPKSKLTGGQKLLIAGLLVLQIPSSLLFYPLAAIFAITGIFVPIAIVLMGIGSLPISLAMRYKHRWQDGGALQNPATAGQAETLLSTDDLGVGGSPTDGILRATSTRKDAR
jgi:hypothetical protein